jgi:hypothetical protein
VAVSLYIAREIFLLSFVGWILPWNSYSFSRNISWPTVDFHWFHFIFPLQKTSCNCLRKKPRIKKEPILQASIHYNYFFHISNFSLGLQEHPYMRTTVLLTIQGWGSMIDGGEILRMWQPRDNVYRYEGEQKKSPWSVIFIIKRFNKI